MASWLVLAFMLLTSTFAQNTPTISISAYAYVAGDTLELDASSLAPNSTYILELRGPEGGTAPNKAETDVLRTDAEGSLSYSKELTDAGTYSLRLAGERMNSTFTLSVAPSRAEGVDERDASGADAQRTPLPLDGSAAGATEADDADATAEPELADEGVADEAAPEAADDDVADEAASEAAEENVADEATPEGVEEGVADKAEAGLAEESEAELAEEPEPEADVGEADVVGAGTAETGTTETGVTSSDITSNDTSSSGSTGTDVPRDDADPADTTGTTGTTDTTTTGEENVDDTGTAEEPAGGTDSEATAGNTEVPSTEASPEEGVDVAGEADEPATETPITEELSPESPAVIIPSGDLPTVGLVRDSVIATDAAGEVVWRLDFPEATGATAGLASAAGRLLVGHGNSLLELAPTTGRVLHRWRLPAQVVDVSFDGASSDVAVRYTDGTERTVVVTNDGPTELLPFDPDPELYDWIRNESLMSDPVERLAQDPTNPFLHLAAERQGAVGISARDDAIAAAATFYERAQVATSILSMDATDTSRADVAMEGALADFLARGYEPELLTDETLAAAYGFPLQNLRRAVDAGDTVRAGFWAEWLNRTSSASVPSTRVAFTDYAGLLQQQGDGDEAALWRSRAANPAGFRVDSTLTQAALSVGRTGWYGIVALLVSILALHITLLAKYWRPQSLRMRHLGLSGKKVTPVLARLSFMRYATFFEKLVMVLLFAATLALAALHGWSAKVDSVPVAWGSGSLGSPAAVQATADLSGDRSSVLFVQGFAQQSAGDGAAAEARYLQLGANAGALNNLAVLLSDPELLQRALQADAKQPVVAANLADPAEPGSALVVPTNDQLTSAFAGTYLGAWAAAFTNPWTALTNMSGVSMPTWIWVIIVALFLLWAALTIVTIVIPRPKLAKNAPRSLVYHLLSILLPGTGLADEFWGILLMVPWAIFGIDFLLHYLPAGPNPGMSHNLDMIVLIAIYVINLVGFFVEFGSYRSRMRSLKEDEPQLALEYGMRVRPADEH